ncbi:5096_t:CDS:2, partial [Rhizophagus irregularis]
KTLATIHISITKELDYFKDKIEEVNNLKNLEKQLSSFIIEIRTKDGSEYKAASVSAAIATIKYHLDSNSVLDLLIFINKAIVSRFCTIADSKLKALAKIVVSSTPKRLIQKFFIYNAVILSF